MATAGGFEIAGTVEVVGARRDLTNADLGAFDPTTRRSDVVLADEVLVLGDVTASTSNKPTPTGTSRGGFVSQPSSVGEDWFELMHVIPRSFELGFVLSSISSSIEVYNAYRRADRTWTGFTNNAGAGVELEGEPGLPATVFSQGGIVMTLEVSTSGPAVVDAALDFVFDVVTIIVPITLERVVLLPFRPEDEYREELEWLTDVMAFVDGSEQRASPREHPRQRFLPTYFLVDEDDDPNHQDERAAFENLLFDWQPRVFGFPVWHEERSLTQAASAGDTVIFIDSTDHADFRVGGLVCLVTDRKTTDVLDVVSFTSNSITLASALVNSYPVGTSVFPCRPCHSRRTVSGSRRRVTASTVDLPLEVIDNEVEIADASAFSTFGGKVLLDGFLFAGDSSRETFDREVLRIDGETGVVAQRSGWDRSRRAGHWRVFVRGRQDLWEHRQLLHALRGRQISFYLPAWRRNLRPILDLQSGSDALDVANVGYAKFVRSRQPKNVVRVSFNDGTAPLDRTIISATEVDADRETLTLDANWPATFPVATVERVEYIEKVRFDSDRVTIVHGGAGAGRYARIEAPVKAVLN